MVGASRCGKLGTVMDPYVTLLNVSTGQVGSYPSNLVSNPLIFSPNVFVRVKSGTKPFTAATYKPMTVEKFAEKHPDKLLNPPLPAKPEKGETNPTKDKDKE